MTSTRAAWVVLLLAVVGAPAPAPAVLPGDFDGDGDVDLADLLFFQSCFSGAGVSLDPGCQSADLDGDNDADLSDFLALQAGFTGVLQPLSPPVVVSSATVTRDETVTLSGTAPGAVQIEIAGGATVLVEPVVGQAVAHVVQLRLNRVNQLCVTGIASDGTRSAPATIAVTHDTRPPSLFVDFPPNGAELTTDTVDVAGRVGDLLSGFMGLHVTVNGAAAVVDVGIGSNGTFFAAGVPLAADGPTVLEAVATDQLGNSITKQISVTHVEIPPETPRMLVVSGNGQTGQIGTALPEPVVVRVTRPDGSAFANKVVTFEVTRSDGRLTSDGTGNGAMMHQGFTDTDGEVRAFWRLGRDAGCGNNRITVTSRDIAGSTFFCASALPAPAAQINVGSGDNQRAEAGAPAPEPLRVWVNDACNGVSDVPVTFSVARGTGLVNGEIETTVFTGNTGHAEVTFTLGLEPGNNAVTATYPGNPAAAARFTVLGVTRDEAQPTRFAGVVLDNANQPIEGATCMLVPAAGDASLFTVTDADGRFRFDTVSAPGLADLHIDGFTATAVGGQTVPQGSFPSLHYVPVLVPNAENTLPTPVLLPRLNPDNAVPFDNTTDVELTVEEIKGLKMIVRAGSMTRADGSVPSAADPATLSLNQVHFDDVPMPMPDGAAPPFAWTLQPGGSTFDPPVEITYPNMSGLPPGSIAYFLSFDHDTNRFEIVATGSVTEDGSCIVSDPGAGITTAGWGGNCPPYSVREDVCSGSECGCCEGECCGDACCGPQMGTRCCEDRCCLFEEACCGGACCGDLTQCCGDHCCPLGTQTCCGDGCCPDDVQCCNLLVLGTPFCCGQGETCCGEICCAVGESCNAGICCPNDHQNCGGGPNNVPPSCCPPGETCCAHQCLPAGFHPCSQSFCCGPEQVCCGEGDVPGTQTLCCAPGEVCVDNECSPGIAKPDGGGS